MEQLRISQPYSKRSPLRSMYSSKIQTFRITSLSQAAATSLRVSHLSKGEMSRKSSNPSSRLRLLFSSSTNFNSNNSSSSLWGSKHHRDLAVLSMEREVTQSTATPLASKWAVILFRIFSNSTSSNNNNSRQFQTSKGMRTFCVQYLPYLRSWERVS